MQTKKGFSVVEILITIGILGLLSAVVVGSFSVFRGRQVLQHEADQIISSLVRARAQTLSSLNSSSYGIHIEADRIIFFAGISFDENSETNEEIVFDDAVVISDVSLDIGNDIVFSRLTGDALYFGTLRIELVSDSAQYKTITITRTGAVSIS